MATVFLQTAIESDKDQELSMHLLADDTAKVWLNGEMALAKLQAGPAVRGQVSRKIKLRKGENILRIQVNQLKKYWNFKIYFTEIDGKTCKTLGGAASP